MSSSQNAASNLAWSVSAAASRRAASSRVAPVAGQVGHRSAGGEDVALDLGERDRRLGGRAVHVPDRIARILPALVEQAEPRAPLVLDEAVAVEVAGVVDPGQGREGVRPQAVEQRVVARPGIRLAQEDEPQRRRVDAAVVGVVGRLARAGHLAGAQLVQDLARLRVVPRIVGRSPGGGRGRVSVSTATVGYERRPARARR